MTNDEIKQWLMDAARTTGNYFFANAYNLITEQEKDIKQLKTECALLDNELHIARQNTIDVLNKLRTYCVEREEYKSIQQQQNEDLLRRNDEQRFHPELTLDEIFVIRTYADKANGQSTMANKVVEKIDQMIKELAEYKND